MVFGSLKKKVFKFLKPSEIPNIVEYIHLLYLQYFLEVI